MDYTQYSTATYISVMTSACCFLVMITSSLLRTHRKKDFFFQSASLQCESHCALYAMACKNISFFLPCMCFLEWEQGLVSCRCILTTVRKTGLLTNTRNENSFLEGSRSFVIGFIRVRSSLGENMC